MLNRIVRWMPRGIEYEADPRQVEKLLREIELEGANGAVTPGVKVLSHQVESENDLPEKEFTRFRALAARANYLAADRIDVLYAAKEVCRFMSRPTDVAMGALKRLARYLRARPRMVFDYEFQTAEGIDCYTDTDWAGCARTRKSTSGGCVMVGRHLIKAWSATQASIALSSGEAEYYGVVRGTGIALGTKALYNDIGLSLPIRIWTDSTAALGIGGRQGLGKLRHLECHSLWVQQRLRRKEFRLLKVDGEVNPADLFTKHLDSKSKLDQVVGLFSCRFLDGRAASAPTLKSDSAVYIAHDPALLPHLHLPEDIASLFEEAVPEPPRRGEEDIDPIEELRDPVPALQAHINRRRKLIDGAGTDRDPEGEALVDTIEPH
jgi:hypothetical protein